MSNELTVLPCPFCGSKHLKERAVPNTNGNRRFIRCLACATEGPWSTLENNAVSLWNHRALEPSPEREPVAWAYTHKESQTETITRQPPDRVSDDLNQYTITPLYAHPPAPRATAPEREGQPVAWMDDRICLNPSAGGEFRVVTAPGGHYNTPLYAHPPAPRATEQALNLTEKDLSFCEDCGMYVVSRPSTPEPKEK